MFRAVLTSLLVALAASFAAAPAHAASLKTCRATAYDDLKAKNIQCATAQRVYDASLRAAQRQSGDVIRFRLVGLRWSCRASNPQRVIDGRYVAYQWRCRAGGGRLMQYRWLSGE